jgi:hypothetical protein
MTEQSNCIGIRMHGVRLNLQCDHRPQLDYTADLMGEHVCDPWDEPDIEVTGSWRLPSNGREARERAFDVTGLDAYGKRMHIGPDTLVWSDTYRDKNMQLRFGRNGAAYAFDVIYSFLPSAKKDAKYKDYESKKYFDLVRYLVFFPIAWHLQRTRGWEMIHASAVESDAGGILIAGPGGAGKTTSSIALVAMAGMKLLTENLVFSDGEFIYPVCEPIRLTDESLALLGDSADTLKGYASAGGLKTKTMFVPPVDPEPDGVKPAVLFLARFSESGFQELIPPALAREQVRATNLLTLELNDYYWYASALDLLWPSLEGAQTDAVEKLTSTTPCYTLGIDRTAGVEAVVERILACLGELPNQILETQKP